MTVILNAWNKLPIMFIIINIWTLSTSTGPLSIISLSQFIVHWCVQWLHISIMASHITYNLSVFFPKLIQINNISNTKATYKWHFVRGGPPVTRAFDKCTGMWKMTPCHAFTIGSSSCHHNMNDRSAMAIVIVWCLLGDKNAYPIIRHQKRQYC